MGLREKALQFKTEKAITNTPIDTIPGPASSKPIDIFRPLDQETPTNKQDPATIISSTNDTSIPKTSTWEVIHKVLSSQNEDTLHDLIIIALWQSYKPNKIALWSGTELALKAYKGKFDQDLPQSIAFTREQKQEIQSIGPVFFLRDCGFLTELNSSGLQTFLILQNNDNLRCLIGMDMQLPESFSQIKSQIAIFEQAVQNVTKQETNEFFIENNAAMIQFINNSLQSFPNMTVIHLAIKNHPRIFNLFGLENTKSIEKEYKNTIMAHVPEKTKVYRISSRDYLILCRTLAIPECESFMSMIKYRIEQIELSHDFRPVPIYRFFSANKDFTCAEKLLTFL